MKRIEEAFKKSKPFIGYLTGGDGGIDYSVACALAMLEGGVDLLEIGVPFSDPVADGPVIQQAHKRALDGGTKFDDVLEIGRKIRLVSQQPMVLFSYANPILCKGKEAFKRLKEAGFDAVLIVDHTYASSADPILDMILGSGLSPIVLATPSTDDVRLASIARIGKGFIYYVSQKGTTGVRGSVAVDFIEQMGRLRRHIKIPIAAGFGIGDKPAAHAVLQEADGFIVGSAFVRLMASRETPETLTALARSIDPRKE